jgi:hypothetical protein
MSQALENLKQPAQPQYVTLPEEKFSSTSHNPIYDPTAIVALGGPGLKNGLYVPATAPQS